MIDAYVEFVTNYMLLASFIQFAVLGLLGELCGAWIANKKVAMPFTTVQTVLKMLAWGVLGVVIKYAFTAFNAVPDALVDHSLASSWFAEKFGKALLTSITMNMFFGPQMMYLHRLTDNLIMKTKGYAGIENSLKTLLWFWIPAHTVTFLLAVEFRIGLAAVWSVVLGIIMGYYKRNRAA